MAEAGDGTDGAWRWRPDKVEQDAHLIEWVQGERGWQPYFRIYGETVARRPPETIWSAADVGSNRTSKREIQRLFPEIAAFDTPKPEALMARVIQIATNKGDIVLDPFAGSGTTAAVAHKMGRRWVTSELVGETIDRFTLPRLVKVARGEDPGGVTEVLEWEGGGGFSILDVAPSMFELDEDAVVLAPWATGGALAEATAAQLGFGYELRGPFCGRRGRTRLAVIDGLVNRAVIELLLEQLAHDENLVVCGTGVDDEARALLATTRPSATLSLIPAAILSAYGRPRRWRPNVPTRTEPVETDGQVAESGGEEVTA